MHKRVSANTKTLQKKFPQVYRDFFANCQKVASASNSFMWMGEFAGYYNGLTLSQKLPLRAYVGFETTFDHKVTISREYSAFEPAKCQFATYLIEEKLGERYQKYLQSYFNHQSKFTGLKVHFLTEVPIGHSMGSNGAIAAALALLVNNKEDFESTFQIAREILSFSQAGNSSGNSAYMALADSSVPVVFRSEASKYAACPLVKDDQNNIVWPIDFGLIFTGTQTTLESIILANSHTLEELRQKAKNTFKLLGNKIVDFRQTYINMLSVVCGLGTDSFSNLLTEGITNASLEGLFNAMNQYQNLLKMLNVSSGTIDLIYSRIHRLANRMKNDVGSGVKISGLGKGGAVLFAVPFGAHRNEIIELINQLREKVNKNIWLDYASWIDGIKAEPGKIEQDLQKKKIAAFIDQDARSILFLKKGIIHSLIITNEKFRDFIKEIDLLVDKTSGKIFIGGETLSSKEIPSQKTTVADLLKSSHFSLDNTQIERSYGNNRYDLQGKIVSPLTKQVKKITGRDLQMKVSGNIYDKYLLSLDPSNITIGVVENRI
jgi:mevalonate kinase